MIQPHAKFFSSRTSPSLPPIFDYFYFISDINFLFKSLEVFLSIAKLSKALVALVTAPHVHMTTWTLELSNHSLRRHQVENLACHDDFLPLLRALRLSANVSGCPTMSLELAFIIGASLARRRRVHAPSLFE